MSLFNLLGTIVDVVTKSTQSGSGSPSFTSKVIDYGDQKIGGGHDHRTNKGSDRTPAQKRADKAKTKSD
jgi:hypothetical protein